MFSQVIKQTYSRFYLMRPLLFFMLINQVVLAQNIDIAIDSCFCEPSMNDTHNIFTNPTPLPNNKYDTLRIYVLPKKHITKRNVYSHQSYYRHIFNDSNSVKYQKVVIANYSTDSLIFKASHITGVYIIQEVLDSNNIWRPIEYINTRIYCSVGEIKTYTLNPSKFCNIYIPRYCGDYKTKIRLKLITLNGNIYSTPFEGSINYDQIYLDPNKLIKSSHHPSLFELKNQKKGL